MDLSFLAQYGPFFRLPLVRAVLLLMPVLGGMVIVAWRFHETSHPVTELKIVIPPIAMSSGFGMFFVSAFRVPWIEALVAFLLGALVFFHPLAKSSTLTRHGDDIVMQRSPGFLLILLALLATRIALHSVVGEYVTPRQTGALFFVLAFGMILRWRATMWVNYRRLAHGTVTAEP